MDAIEACRTAVLGGHVDLCGDCGQQVSLSYNSCRNRHCPKCQGSARLKWLKKREGEVLPVPYFHVVFTLPANIAELAQYNKRIVYGLLFHSTAETLLTIARDPNHLGACIGFLAVLHTWGQPLLDHPHLHCVVPAGGLSVDRQRWISCRPGFFLPVRVLSRLFRRLFLSGLRTAYDQGQLHFDGKLAPLSSPAAFSAFLAAARKPEWAVYVKPPFGSPVQVLRYLGRYTHRVAFSNDRLVAIDNDQVTFRFKDYTDGSREKTMTLVADEFIRRFLLHVLPDHFLRIRHFGLFANRHRQRNLEACRRLIAASLPAPLVALDSGSDAPRETPQPEEKRKQCPHCGGERVLRLQIPAGLPFLVPFTSVGSSPRQDSS
jgi:Zn finger protein HypA/HybF involved in hydrogenase expression